MSKAPKNIEKILLGVAVVAGGGLAALGFMKLGKAEEDFPTVTVRAGQGDPGVPGAARIPGTLNSLTSNRMIAPGMVESGRAVDLFVGVPLFSHRDDPNNPVDLQISEDVHDAIPNEWWLETGASPNFADSPDRDPDGDGFSNIEEFVAKTDPMNDQSHPELANKLEYVDEESVAWLLEFGFETNGLWLPKIQNINTGEKSRMPFDKGVKPGDSFFPEGEFKDRFKMLGIEERTQRNERLNIDETMRWGLYEDLKENKKGKKYEIPQRIPRAEKPEYYNYDRTGIFELNALGRSGSTFKVEEGTRFALPHDAEEKKYLLHRITPDEAEIHWDVDGETKTLIIPKG